MMRVWSGHAQRVGATLAAGAALLGTAFVPAALLGTAFVAGCGGSVNTDRHTDASRTSPTPAIARATGKPVVIAAAPAGSTRTLSQAAGLHGFADEILADPAGHASFETVARHAYAETIDSSGRTSAPRILFPARTKAGYTAVAHTPGGLIAAEIRTGSRQELRIVDQPAGGVPGTPQVVSSPTFGFIDLELDVGPTGAVAVPFDEEPGNSSYRERMAFRPARATRFNPTIKLKPYSDHSNTHFQVVMGPDGGGVLLGINGTQRPSFVQRISPRGAIGPAIPIQTGLDGATYGHAAFAHDGTLAVALTIDGTSSATTAERTGVFATTLAPGADHFGTVTRLGPGGNSSTSRGNFALTISDDHHMTVLAGEEEADFQIYDGDDHGWRHTAVLRSPFGFEAQLDVTPDGGLTAIWDDNAGVGGPSAGDTEHTAIFASHRPPHGQFNAPHALTAGTIGGTNLDLAASLPNGDIAFAFYREQSPYHAGAEFAAVATP